MLPSRSREMTRQASSWTCPYSVPSRRKLLSLHLASKQVKAELERRMLCRRYAVVAVILVAITASACGARERGQRASVQSAATEIPSGEVTWSLLPEAPLRPRHGAHGLWVNNLFLVMGGRDTPACPPDSHCGPPSRPALRDAASYSPTTGRWTQLADAPVPLAEATTAVAGDVVYWWIPYGDDHRVGDHGFPRLDGG